MAAVHGIHGGGRGRSSECALVFTLALALVGCASSSPTPSASPLPSSWQQVLARVGAHGEVDKEMALEAFALAIGALPGVTLPAGPPPAESELLDLTPAVDWLEAVWDQLSPGQQQAATEALVPFAMPQVSGQGLPGAIALAGAVDGGGLAQSLPTASPEGQTCALWRQDAGAAPTDAPALVAAEAKAVYDIANTLSSRLHRAALPRWALCFVPHDLNPYGLSVTRVYDANGGSTGEPNDCALFLDKDFIVAVRAGRPGTWTYALAVAALRCFIGSPAGSALGRPPWVELGLPAWVGGTIAVEEQGTIEGTLDAAWRGYLTLPEAGLYQRAADAVGFFSQLNATANLWDVVVPIAAAGDSEAAFIASGATTSSVFPGIWAAGFFRDPAGGPPWNIAGPDITADAAAASPVKVANGEEVPVTADPVSDQIRQVETTADITQVQGNEVRIFDGKSEYAFHGSVAIEAAGLFCTRQGQNSTCECPAGSLRFGDPVPTKLGNSFHFALTGMLVGGTGKIKGESLAEFCHLQTTPSPPPSATPPPKGKAEPKGGADPCAAGCGESVGDPHLTTIAGQQYDFQAAGEYILLRSTDGSFMVQARQKPVTEDASSDVALAWLVNGHRVSMYELPGPAGAGYTLRVDGVVTPPFQTVDLGSGAQIAGMGFGIEVAWPDGTLAWAFPSGHEGNGLGFTIAPSSALRPTLSGLLAPISAGSDIPPLADGTVLPSPTDHQGSYVELYTQLAPSWHVSDQNSLFDYGAGESTASFDVAGFPPADAPLTVEEAQAGATVDQVAAATDACAGIAGDEREQLRCIFDVLITQDPAWAAFYQLLLKFLDQGPDALQGEQPLPAGMVSLTDIDTTANNMVVLPDGTLAAAVSHADLSSELLRIDPTSGRIETRTSVSAAVPVGFAAGSLWLSTGDGQACAIERVDPTTLSKQGSVTVPCGDFGPTLVTAAEAAWTSDGISISRIDPQSMSLGPPISIPVASARLLAGSSAVFAGGLDQSAHWYKLEANDSVFTDLGELSDVVAAAGDALWTADAAGAGRHREPGAPDTTIPIDGVPVAADESAVYAARDASGSGKSELWRYPVDGSPPSMVLENEVELPAVIGTAGLHYIDATVFSGGGRLVAVWLTRSGPDQPSVMYLQSAATP